VFIGGSGNDSAMYTTRTTISPSTSSTAPKPTTAPQRKRRRQSDIENIFSAARRTLGRDSSANLLSGSAGNDVIKGNGGHDKLIGGAGRDTITSGAESSIFSCWIWARRFRRVT